MKNTILNDSGSDFKLFSRNKSGILLSLLLLLLLLSLLILILLYFKHFYYGESLFRANFLIR